MDNQEFETKVLNIDVVEVVKKLRSLGAKERTEFLARRYVFDIDSKDTEFIRLREMDPKVYLTYKLKPHYKSDIGQTTEIEVEVSDFDKTSQILRKLNFKRIFYIETKHHIFNLNGIEFSIDTWPKLSPLLEVEAKSIEKINEGLDLLGFSGKDVGDKDINLIYKEIGIDMHAEPELKFD